MKSSKVAKRYARALMGLSSDHAQLEAWGAELERLARIVDSPEIAGALESPEVSHEARMEALGKIAERLELSFPLRSFAVVVASHGRVADLTAMSEAYAGCSMILMGRARATLTFAYAAHRRGPARVVARARSDRAQENHPDDQSRRVAGGRRRRGAGRKNLRRQPRHPARRRRSGVWRAKRGTRK